MLSSTVAAPESTMSSSFTAALMLDSMSVIRQMPAQCIVLRPPQRIKPHCLFAEF